MHVAQEEAVKKNEQKEKLELKMKEVSDQRDFFHDSIGHLENKITTYKNYIATQNQQKNLPIDVEGKIGQKKKRQSRSRGDNKDLASVSSVSKVSKISSPMKRSIRGN